MITKQQLEEWRRLSNGASQGFWAGGDKSVKNGEGYICSTLTQADTEFIAASREAVPKLIDEVERLTKVLEERTSE